MLFPGVSDAVIPRSYDKYTSLECAVERLRGIEADILTISRGNSILVLSCSFKVSKYISECLLR